MNLDDIVRALGGILALAGFGFSVEFLVRNWSNLEHRIRRLLVPYSVLNFFVMTGIVEHLRRDDSLTFASLAAVPLFFWLSMAYIVEKSERFPWERR